MQPFVNTIPGYRVMEYRLALSLPEELRVRIQKIRKEFATSFQLENSGSGRPQLTLAAFSQHAMLEERIMNRLRTVAMGYPPFKVELRDFGSYPSHSIFINVESKAAVTGLVKSIRTEAQRLMKMNEEQKPFFIGDPHIIVAAKLKPWQYEKGWLEYSHRHFSGRFIATEMLVQRREEGALKYQTIHAFSLQNMPVATRQGQLF